MQLSQLSVHSGAHKVVRACTNHNVATFTRVTDNSRVPQLSGKLLGGANLPCNLQQIRFGMWWRSSNMRSSSQQQQQQQQQHNASTAPIMRRQSYLMCVWLDELHFDGAACRIIR
jgi:hypothetical protein